MQSTKYQGLFSSSLINLRSQIVLTSSGLGLILLMILPSVDVPYELLGQKITEQGS